MRREDVDAAHRIGPLPVRTARTLVCPRALARRSTPEHAVVTKRGSWCRCRSPRCRGLSCNAAPRRPPTTYRLGAETVVCPRFSPRSVRGLMPVEVMPPRGRCGRRGGLSPFPDPERCVDPSNVLMLAYAHHDDDPHLQYRFGLPQPLTALPASSGRETRTCPAAAKLSRAPGPIEPHQPCIARRW